MNFSIRILCITTLVLTISSIVLGHEDNAIDRSKLSAENYRRETEQLGRFLEDEKKKKPKKPKYKPSGGGAPSGGAPSGGSSGGGSSSGGSSGGGSSGGGSSSGGSSGGGSSANSSGPSGAQHPGAASSRSAGPMLLGAAVAAAGAIAALKYRQNKRTVSTSDHALKGALAKRMKRFEHLAGVGKNAARPDRVVEAEVDEAADYQGMQMV